VITQITTAPQELYEVLTGAGYELTPRHDCFPRGYRDLFPEPIRAEERHPLRTMVFEIASKPRA
jgi:hypothetical protein